MAFRPVPMTFRYLRGPILFTAECVMWVSMLYAARIVNSRIRIALRPGLGPLAGYCKSDFVPLV